MKAAATLEARPLSRLPALLAPKPMKSKRSIEKRVAYPEAYFNLHRRSSLDWIFHTSQRRCLECFWYY
jgi:hypothetical protein